VDVKDSNVGYLNNVQREAVRYFGEKREYLKAKIDKLETNIQNANIKNFYRCINGFKKGTCN